ncbi:restriction endonuclease subunit S [Cryobacterium sp. TMT1-2-1]|uniref:restriction endonuclease subunit S n=1 Tax=Cryobacterium sp. TMT1-2-1 TaxID=1259232 RepID=UPI00106DC83C|nr:restriction endonuclease subunit S [Cryobacterium sp. TMT1-2-1]TFD42589.1 restriction endonuclease subunit S [Cryobacterium sp. TMT1-2-1]
MSRIDELIAELTPSGVPYVPLSKVAEFSTTRVDASDIDDTSYVGVDNLVALKGGRVDSSYPPNTARLTAYEPGDVLLGNIRPYLKKVWLASNSGGCSSDVLAIRIKHEARHSLTPAYVYYVLSSDDFFVYNTQHAKGAKMPRGEKAAILGYRIPVPPLEVQTEVVRVLDQFTRLETDLRAEQQARLAQYEHYRAELIRNIPGETEWRTLGAVANVRTGQAPPDGVPAESGEYSFVNAGTAESGRSPLQNTDGDAVTIPSRGQGGVGVVGYQREPFWCGPLCYRIWSTNEVVSTRFLYHFLKSIQPSIRGLQQTGGTPALNRKELVLVAVPVPAIEVQKHIVNVLDQFDGLVNDIDGGIPAEIRMRRNQYEHYRHRLLRFKELEA